MFRFQLHYFLLTLLLLGVEIFIGACMHDAVIRPYGGDVLVVILLYCLIRSFWQLPVVPLAPEQLHVLYLMQSAGAIRGMLAQLCDSPFAAPGSLLGRPDPASDPVAS